MTWAGLFILDENDNPVPCTNVLEWGRWFDRIDRRRVADTDLGSLGRVSTVFLAIDHGLGLIGGEYDPLIYKPVLWETMVFGGPWDRQQWRYNSAEAAKRNHIEVVNDLRASSLRRFREEEDV